MRYRGTVITLFDSRWVLGIAAFGATLSSSVAAHAHFVLQAPAANMEQGPLGDPQKDPPCGGAGTATGMVTAYQAGETIMITIDETVPHPGHYRVALAVNDPSELPPEPEVTEGDSDCGSAAIMNPAAFPVLADGMLVHTSAFGEPQTFEVTLPDDIECESCTLQVLEFMSDHGAPCFYHHCATISISGASADGSTSASTDDSGGSSEGESTAATTPTTDPTADDATATNAESEGEGTNGSDSASATAATTTVTTTDTDTAGGDDDDGGCGCTTDANRPTAMLLGVLGLVALRRRRRQ